MSDLDTLLNENAAPAARLHLSARILAAAETVEPANDVHVTRPWWSVAGVAAMAVMAAFFILQPGADTEDDWNQIAEASGFSDLYDWVEGDES